ncbi:MAG: type II toxin-antitoxin system RelB/DinJ family antitoxin [Oscillospiraceae bacterium]|nr:type II toxin-antitoxin system RelB/DinJ family antitoxin [Oscillospiraceae bacterium]
MKTSNVYTRVEPEIKEQADQIFSKLGIPMANAINLFLHQVVLRKGIPFDVSLPQTQNMPLDYSKLTEEEFNAAMEEGFKCIEAGRVTPAEKVWEEMQRQYNL